MNPEDLSKAVREASDLAMSRRRGVIGLSLAAAGSMGLIALYQSGVIRHIPEPPLPALDADKVDASAEAFKRFEVGDAFHRLLRVIAPLIIGGTFVILTVLERRRPLRKEHESKLRRLTRNLVFAGMAAATVNLLERPMVQPLAGFVERRQWGLLYGHPLPQALRVTLAVLMLDYTLYVWHVLVHKVPWLWRFHIVRHMDLDLDASTALRFHCGELAASIPWRAAQIAVIGVSPEALTLWQNALLVSILFHHSNVELPMPLERVVSKVFVTPRMHGIHHSVVPDETNSNWSSGLTVWDWLHGTLRLNVPQRDVTIGVPAYRDPEEVTLAKTVALPFVAQRPWRLLPGDGEPGPHEQSRPAGELER